jgi:hypothetical protein
MSRIPALAADKPAGFGPKSDGWRGSRGNAVPGPVIAA